MKEFKYAVPAESIFEGHVLLSIPKYKARIKAIKDLNLQVKENGEVETSTSQFDSVEKIIDLVEKHVLAVDLKVKESGEELKEVDDLGYSQEGSELINEIGNMLLGGIKLGKN